MEGDQPVQSHSYAQQPSQPQLVCRSIVLVIQDSLVGFPGRLLNVSSTSPKLLIQCGFILKETVQLVSGNVEFNAYQVSLLLLS